MRFSGSILPPHTPRWATALLVTVLAAWSAPATAELIRVPVSAGVARNFPVNFDALAGRVEALGMVITWRQEPQHDPYYSHLGPARFGSLNIEAHAGETFTINWCQFDTPEIARAHVDELNANSADAVTLERHGHTILIVYGHAYPTNSDASDAILERLLNRS